MVIFFDECFKRVQCSVFMMDRINTRHAIRVCVCCRNAIETTSEILYSRLTAICARNCGPVAIDIYICGGDEGKGCDVWPDLSTNEDIASPRDIERRGNPNSPVIVFQVSKKKKVDERKAE